MADSPDPNGPHQYLYHRHLLARARARGATEAAAVGAVGCVICGASTTIEPASRRGVEQTQSAGPGGGEGVERDVVKLVSDERVQVVGHVEEVRATSMPGMWRVTIAGRVLFAREGDGCA